MRLYFGGSSSSSSAQTTNQTDNRRTIGPNAISAENSTVNVLDGGAIENSFIFADRAFQTAVAGVGEAGLNATKVVADANRDALNFAARTDAKALDFATTANAQAADTLANTSNLVKDAYADAKGRGALTDKILIGSIAMAGLVAVMALRKK